DLCLHNGQIVAVSGGSLYTVAEGKLNKLAEGGRTLLGAASYSGTVYVHDGKEVGLLEGGKIEFENITDWDMLERGSTIRDMMAYGSRLYFATDEGLGLLRGMTW